MEHNCEYDTICIEFFRTFIRRIDGKCITVTKLYKFLRIQSSHIKITDLFADKYLGKPVYINNICKYGWIGYQLLHPKKIKQNLFYDFCRNELHEDSQQIKNFIYIDDLWKLYKIYLLKFHNKKYNNRQKFNKQVFTNLNKYCVFYEKNMLIVPKKEILDTGLEKYYTILLQNNLSKMDNNIRIADLWDNIKKYTLQQREITLTFRDKKKLFKILQNEPYNVMKNEKYLIGFQYKFPIESNASCISGVSIKLSVPVLDENIVKLRHKTIDTIRQFTYSDSGDIYFNHKEIYDMLHIDSPTLISLFADDNIKLIDRNDARPICIQRDYRLVGAYGEFSERVIYDVITNNTIDLKSSITKHFNDLFIVKYSVAEKLYDDITNKFKPIQCLLQQILSISMGYSRTYAIQPTIRAHNYVIRPDIIINDTVYDIKEIHSLSKMNRLISFQLLFYFSILNTTSELREAHGFNVKSMGIIIPNKHVIIKFHMDEWILNNMSSKFLLYLRLSLFHTDLAGNILSELYDIPKVYNKNKQKENDKYIHDILGPLLTHIPYTIYHHNG